MVYEYYTEVGVRREATATSKLRREEILSYLNTERMKYLLHEADRIDAGKLEKNDVLDPQGYVLISMTTDGRNAGDEPYWLKIIDLLRDATLEATLHDPEVQRRCQRIRDEQEKLRKLLLERTTMKGNVIYCDLRGVKEIPDGNRFLIFTLFPKGNIQVKVTHDSQRENTTAICHAPNTSGSTAISAATMA